MVEEVPRESLLEKMKGEDSSSSSSSDSDSETKKVEQKVEQKVEEKVEAVEDGIYHLFGRKRPVHHVLGGAKSADVLLWRNKKISAGVVGGATAIWVFFELLEYHLLTLVCHCLILSLSILFLWSNASALINKSAPRILEVHIPEDLAVNVALSLRSNINCAISVLRDIASGKDLKKFLGVIAGLWFLSIVGSSCSFLTLFYVVFILVHTVPVLYEKYDDKVDAFAEKAMAEIKKQYAVFDAKVLSKIPKGPLKDKKH